MHSRYFISGFLLLFCVTAIAQKEQTALEGLKAPSMPASSIIGIQANEVNRPKSLKSLETALLNNFKGEQDNFVLPNSFALELNPYMLNGRKNFNYKSYLDTNVGQNLWRNFSISVSSTTNFVINDSTSANAMGIGFRTLILNGHVNPEVVEIFKQTEIDNQQAMIVQGKVPNFIYSTLDSLDSNYTFTSFLEITLNRIKNTPNYSPSPAYQAAIEVLISIPPNTPKENIEDYFIDHYQETYSKKVYESFKALVQNVKMNRYGWQLEVDLAYALSFPDNNFNYSVSPRWGAWLNASYKPLVKKKDDKGEIMKNKSGGYLMRPSNFEFIGLARVFQNNQDFFQNLNPEDSTYKAGNFFDIGGRMVWEKKKFSIELEAIYRINNTTSNVAVAKNSSVKYIVNANYNISQNIVVSYYLGKDFDQPYSGNLISGLSLNFGFGDIKLKDVMPD